MGETPNATLTEEKESEQDDGLSSKRTKLKETSQSEKPKPSGHDDTSKHTKLKDTSKSEKHKKSGHDDCMPSKKTKFNSTSKSEKVQEPEKAVHKQPKNQKKVPEKTENSISLTKLSEKESLPKKTAPLKKQKSEKKSEKVQEPEKAVHKQPENKKIAPLKKQNSEEKSPSLKNKTSKSTKNEKREKIFRERKEKHESGLFQTRMTPLNVVSLCDKLSDEQRKAIEEIGFAGILDLKMKTNNKDLITYLIKNFDYCRSSIKLIDDEIVVDEDDVHAVFGLPMGPDEVVEGIGRYEKNKESGYVAFLESWRLRWGEEKAGPTPKKIVQELCKRKDSGDEFKQDFVVLVVGTLLSGVQDIYANYKILHCIRDVSKISKMNWCRYTLKSMTSSISDWKNGRTSFFTGPCALLTLTYLDRMVFKYRMVNRAFPICSNWTQEIINKRLLEEKESGGFGRGKVVKSLKSPTNMDPGHCPEAGKEPEIMKDNTEKVTKALAIIAVGKEPEITKDNTEKVTKALAVIAAAVEDFGKVMCEVGKEESTATILKKTFSQPDIVEQEQEASGQPQKSQPQPIWDSDDEFFNQPSVLKAIDDLERAYHKTIQVKTTEEEMPSFNLGIPSPRGTPIPENTFNEIMEEVDELEEVEDDGIEKRQPRQLHNLPLCLRSPFFTASKEILTRLLKKDELITDYALFPAIEAKKGELLFKNNYLSASRNDFATFNENEWLTNNIIDVFSFKLNVDNSRRAIGQPSRIFFSTLVQIQLELNKEESTMQKNFENCITQELKIAGNLNIENADLVFFPVIRESHFWLLCINFKSKNLEIIDNRTLPLGKRVSDNYDGIPIKLAKLFGIYLGKNNLKKNMVVETFKEKLIKMPWRSPDNNIDCGIYCMRHMETYNGEDESWNCGFQKNKDNAFIKELRAKYCTGLILMERNELKNEVLEKAKRYTRVAKS